MGVRAIWGGKFGLLKTDSGKIKVGKCFFLMRNVGVRDINQNSRKIFREKMTAPPPLLKSTPMGS